MGVNEAELSGKSGSDHVGLAAGVELHKVSRHLVSSQCGGLTAAPRAVGRESWVCSGEDQTNWNPRPPRCASSNTSYRH